MSNIARAEQFMGCHAYTSGTEFVPADVARACRCTVPEAQEVIQYLIGQGFLVPAPRKINAPYTGRYRKRKSPIKGYQKWRRRTNERLGISWSHELQGWRAHS